MTTDLIDLLKEHTNGPLLKKVSALLGENTDVVSKGLITGSNELLKAIAEGLSNDSDGALFHSFGDGSKLDKLQDRLAGGNQTVNFLNENLDKARNLLGDKTDQVFASIAQYSGLRNESIPLLMGIVQPLVTGLLGKQKASGLDQAALQTLARSAAGSLNTQAQSETLADGVSITDTSASLPMSERGVEAMAKAQTIVVPTGESELKIEVGKALKGKKSRGKKLVYIITVLAIFAALFFYKDSIKDFTQNIKNKTTQTTDTDSKLEMNTATQTKQIEDALAKRFVKLALGIGQHDQAFVDAYHGPQEWSQAAEQEQRSLDDLLNDANTLLKDIDAFQNRNQRMQMLRKQTIAAITRIQMTQGKTFSFDEETRLLYDAIAPQYNLVDFDNALQAIENLLPGDGSLSERVEEFENSIAIADDKLQQVFDAAIAECRRRTLAHYELPESENFQLEFVNNKPWSGYNWYQGDYTSLIQVNTDFPINISRAIDLGCHEGYPGHHTWNAILERDVLNTQNWIEYSVYPLFSPLSIIAEGSANYGIKLAFPGDEKMIFERDVLYPLAGINPDLAAVQQQLQKARVALSHSSNHIAREYLDGRISKDAAIELNMKYSLRPRAKAEQSINFVETYRGYVINYNLGQDLIKAYVEREVATGVDPWDAFEHLLRTPTSASQLQELK